MRFLICLAASLVAMQAYGQWDIQDSHTTASLRSVHALSDKIAWVSGPSGLVLHTNDGGSNWLPCVIPKGAGKLDFNGIQGFDENTAIVMSAGKGRLSQIFKTGDGCKTWKLVFTNPDDGGSFKGIRRVSERQLYLLGDQVDGKFAVFYSADGGEKWFPTNDPGLEAEKGEVPISGNGSLISVGPFLFFGTKGPASFKLYQTYPNCSNGTQNAGNCPIAWSKTEVPLSSADLDGTGFSVAARTQLNLSTGKLQTILVAVGASTTGVGSAVISKDSGKSWTAAILGPGASRLAVGYFSSKGLWITVGPNGTDSSADDGQRWHPLQPTQDEPKDAGQNWSALSFPFVVGEGGRIGKLNASVLEK
jgi:photosystem II stability/assembly factor-like uncharacterized protein